MYMQRYVSWELGPIHPTSSSMLTCSFRGDEMRVRSNWGSHVHSNFNCEFLFPEARHLHIFAGQTAIIKYSLEPFPK